MVLIQKKVVKFKKLILIMILMNNVKYVMWKRKN